MKKHLIILLCLIMIVLTFTGCKSERNATKNKKTIAVSIVPQATFAQKICDDKLNIVTVIPAGASPETYEPTPSQMKKLSSASLYFAIGVPSEESSVLPILSPDTKIVKLHKKVNHKIPDRTIDSGRDPHIWLSPKRVIIIVSAMAEALKEADPDNAEFYDKNAKSYIAELNRLDSYISSALADKTNRKFIAFHPAFGYYADDYNLTMYALEEHGKEATAKHLTKMADLAKKENIKAIFYQAENSAKQAISFAEEINGEALMLEPLAPDYINNLKKMTDLLSKAMK